MAGRTVICVEMGFSGVGLEIVKFYEPATDKRNDCSYDELITMLNDGTLELHTPEQGRVLKSTFHAPPVAAPVTKLKSIMPTQEQKNGQTSIF